jgi:RNA polymerase sigma-70 factor (ECF subfamily)
MSEKQLIEGCLNGNRSAQKELYDLYSSKMMGLCMRYVGNRETARDLLQDGFVKVFTSLKLYSGTGSFESWMRKIFVNVTMEHFRKKDFLYDTMDLDSIQSSTEDNSTVSRLSAEMIMELVQRLPDGFRTIFNLFAIEGYSHKEIGEQLQISEATSRSQYARARQWLQKWIKMGEIEENRGNWKK